MNASVIGSQSIIKPLEGQMVFRLLNRYRSQRMQLD